MISRTQLLERLSTLKNFKFVAYIDKLTDDSHIVRLKVPLFEKTGLSADTVVMDYIVTEEAGYLSATTIDGVLKFKRLS